MTKITFWAFETLNFLVYSSLKLNSITQPTLAFTVVATDNVFFVKRPWNGSADVPDFCLIFCNFFLKYCWIQSSFSFYFFSKHTCHSQTCQISRKFSETKFSWRFLLFSSVLFWFCVTLVTLASRKSPKSFEFWPNAKPSKANIGLAINCHQNSNLVQM